MSLETLSKDVASFRSSLYRTGEGSPNPSQKQSAGASLIARIERFRDNRSAWLSRVDAGEYGFDTPADARSQQQRLISEVAQCEEWVVDLRHAISHLNRKPDTRSCAEPDLM